MIDDKKMDHLLQLTKLKLDDEQRKEIKGGISEILDYMKILDQADTSDIEPATHPSSIHSIYRDDVVADSDMSGDIVKLAPQTEDERIKVAETF